MKYFSAFQLGVLHCFRHIFLFPDTVHIYSYGVCISCVNWFSTNRSFGTKWSQIRYVISVTLLSPSIYYLLTSAAMLPILYKYFHVSVSMLTASHSATLLHKTSHARSSLRYPTHLYKSKPT